MSTSSIIDDVRSLLAGDPVYLTGSLVAADVYGRSEYHDVDLFTPTEAMLCATTQKLIDHGYKVDDRFARVWQRWLNIGTGRWHTNSMRLHSPSGVETNIVFKKADGHPTTSLAQVIESFDFGLLAVGWDLRLDQFRDMRSYLFPGLDPDGPLPMMPNKQANWRAGFISQYNGIRESGRYAKYYNYGYDLTAVKDDLITGYRNAALYYVDHFDKEQQKMAKIYESIAYYIDMDDIDMLVAADKKINYNDSLDQIMEALE